MSVLTWLHNEAQIIEADVQKIVAALIKAEHVAIADLEKSLSYINNAAPHIVTGLAAASKFVELLGPAVPEGPAVDLALKAAQGLVGELQNFSQQYQQATTGGGISAEQAKTAIVNGYNMLSTAKAAVAQINALASKPVAK